MNISIFFRLFSLSCLLMATLIFAGCNDSKIGAVSGVVLIDGEPVEMASISFHPDSGRASVGRTNDKGEYVLNYTRGQKGALIGNHKVTISTKYVAETNYNPTTKSGEAVAELSETDRIRGKGRKEMVPEKYRDRDKTELTAVVEAGSNRIDFKLEL